MLRSSSLSRRPAPAALLLVLATTAGLIAVLLAPLAVGANGTQHPQGAAIAFVVPPESLVADAPVTGAGGQTVEVAVTGSISVALADLPTTLGAPTVTLTLLDRDGAPVSDSSGAPALGGATDVPVTDGRAAFPDLTLGETPSARGYQVEAALKLTGEDAPRATTRIGPFSIWGDVVTCAATPCVPATVERGDTRVRLTLGNPGIQRLGLVDEDPYGIGSGCAGYHARLPDTVLFDTELLDDGTGTALVTVQFDRSETPGIGGYQVCYVSDKDFKARTGSTPTIDDDPDFAFGPALLPECTKDHPQAPCVASRRALGGTEAIPLGEIVVRVPAGDPMFR